MKAEAPNKKRRADLLLIAALLLIAGIALFLQRKCAAPGGEVAVYYENECVGRYALDEEQTVELTTPDGTGHNTLLIAHGTADMTDADCPDALCVDMRPISRDGESIICLPHRFSIRIEGGEASDTDA